jgi:hypothetical protein
MSHLPVCTYGLNCRCSGMSFHVSRSHGGVMNLLICLLIVLVIVSGSFDLDSSVFVFIIGIEFSLCSPLSVKIRVFSSFYLSFSFLGHFFRFLVASRTFFLSFILFETAKLINSLTSASSKHQILTSGRAFYHSHEMNAIAPLTTTRVSHSRYKLCRSFD